MSSKIPLFAPLLNMRPCALWAHRDHFVRRLSVCPVVTLLLVVTHSYVSQATHAFLGMLPLCCFVKIHCHFTNCTLNGVGVCSCMHGNAHLTSPHNI